MTVSASGALLASPQADVYKGLFGLYRAEGKRGAEKLPHRASNRCIHRRPSRFPSQALSSRVFLRKLQERAPLALFFFVRFFLSS